MNEGDGRNTRGNEARPRRAGDLRRRAARFLRRHSGLPVLLLLGAVLILLAFLNPPPRKTPARPASSSGGPALSGAERTHLVERIRSATSQNLWDVYHELEDRYGRNSGSVGALFEERGLFSLPEAGKLIAALFVLRHATEVEDRNAAFTALLELAHEARDTEVRLAAIRTLGREGEIERVYPVLERLLRDTVKEGPKAAAVAAAVWSALWELDNSTSPAPLRALLRAEDFAARAAAALSLAHAGYHDPEVLAVLDRLRREPTPRGREAELLYVLETGGTSPPPTRSPEVEEPASAPSSEGAARTETRMRDSLDEVVSLARERFFAPDTVRPQDLYERAYKAAVAGLPYSRFLGPEDLERLELEALGRRFGIGADLVKLDRESDLVVARTYPELARGLPEDARLRTGDRILAVDGVPTRGLEAEEIAAMLGTKAAGDLVFFKVERWGWKEPRRIAVRCRSLNAPRLSSEVLPEGILYVRLYEFSAESAREFETAVARLFDKGELRGVLLDLRDNPGGRLQAAVKIADLFVSETSKPIVAEVRGDGRERVEYAPTAEHLLHEPAVVLVNRRTASAAEVLAGALQAFGRAKVVGERTFGKGVSQERVPAPESAAERVGGRSALEIATYYLELPDGRRFHGNGNDSATAASRGGIIPDVEVVPDLPYGDPERAEVIQRVELSRELHEYVRAHIDAIRSLWEEGELWDPDRHPEAGFQALHRRLEEALRVTLQESEVRSALRSVLRRYLEEEREREFAVDLGGDRTLGTALKVLLAEIGIEGEALEAHPFYGRLAGKAPPGEAQEEERRK